MLAALPTPPAPPAEAPTLESDGWHDLATLADEHDRSLDRLAALLDALDVCLDTERLQALAGALRHSSFTPAVRSRLEHLVDLAVTRGEVDAYRRALGGARTVLRADPRDDASREHLYRLAWRKHELTAAQVDALLAVRSVVAVRLEPPEPAVEPKREQTPS